jgi:hypothetical protein
LNCAMINLSSLGMFSPPTAPGTPRPATVRRRTQSLSIRSIPNP